MTNRYERNMQALTPEENDKLKSLRVAVVGCGGLGGYIIEMLGRLGIGEIVAIDGDVFEESNLNRQILSLESNLGKSKAQAAVERMAQVNGQVRVHAHRVRLTRENGEELLENCCLAFDALDNVPSRKDLLAICGNLGIPFVHGAIGGWFGQVSVVYPGDRGLIALLSNSSDRGIEVELGNPAFTPALVAGLEVAEGLKAILGRPGILQNKMLTIDLLNQDFEIIDL